MARTAPDESGDDSSFFDTKDNFINSYDVGDLYNVVNNSKAASTMVLSTTMPASAMLPTTVVVATVAVVLVTVTMMEKEKGKSKRVSFLQTSGVDFRKRK